MTASAAAAINTIHHSGGRDDIDHQLNHLIIRQEQLFLPQDHKSAHKTSKPNSERKTMTARITIDGNLVADPDFGVGNSGTSWAHMRVASHERIRRDGEWVSTDPEFFNVTVFGEEAEAAANHLHKGDRVDLTGRVQLETFDRRDGSTGAAIKVYARTISKHEDRPAQAAGPFWGLVDDPDHPGQQS